MKKLLLCTALAATSTTAEAQTIDSIIVTGTQPVFTVTNPAEQLSTIESIMPTQEYNPGGYGGFISNTERGTQSVHTAVYRNGIPVMDAGTGWYDFSHDIPTGNERISIVNGPNGVLYGSGSLGGTVFIRDEFQNNVTTRLGDDHYLISATALDAVNISYFKVNNGSVMANNTEEDWYENVTARIALDNFAAHLTDYTYDYDDCWSMNDSGNDCTQKGTRGGAGLYNDNFAIGYNFNDTEFYTDGLLTWESSAKRYYADAHDTFGDFLLGATVSHESYLGNNQTLPAVYASYNIDSDTSVGVRLIDGRSVFRFGTTLLNTTVQVSSSYRNPTLYEKHGDAWVNSNNNLKAEQGYGVESTTGPITLFAYTFTEGIQYDNSLRQYTNTGSYTTAGARVNYSYKGFSVFAGYTDTPLERVPQYKAKISYTTHGLTVSYTGNYKRKNADDYSIVDISYNHGPVTASIQNVTDNDYEPAPGYSNPGVQFLINFSKEY